MMGFMDKVKGMVGQHHDKVDKGLERGGEAAESRTRGRHRKQVRTGTGKAREAAERMSRERGEQGGTPGGPAA